MNEMEKQALKYSQTKQTTLFSFKDEYRLILCSKTDPQFCYFYTTHYPKSKGIMGRQFYYKIFYGDEFIGIIGASSPPLQYRKFREYFDSDNDLLWLNNNVYRIVKGAPNRGTQILKLFRETIFRDYYQKYGDLLLGLITFVEPPRDGVVYKADNWVYLGMTQGKECKRRKENNNEKTFTQGVKKHIYGMRFHKRYTNKLTTTNKLIKS